jgi:hypothetical protein
MIKTEEILIRGSKNKITACDIFIYEPENIEETTLGSLYMVSELTVDKSSSQLTGLLSSLIKREYYSMPHRGAIDSLEASLKKANQMLSELANQGNLKWLGNLHFLCAAICKEENLFLTQTGSAQAFLYREENLASITKKAVPSPEKPHPTKTFQSVVSGKITAGDKILFGTPSLFEFFNPQGFKQLFDLPKIEMIADHINKILREQKKPPPLAGLLMEIIAEQEPIMTRERKDFITPPLSLKEITG